jgi:peptidyl-prolyl cis-trans isomerase A (cyclophilin A)
MDSVAFVVRDGYAGKRPDRPAIFIIEVVMSILRKICLLAALCGVAVWGFDAENPMVLIQTELGDITVEIYLQKAPITAKNFMAYVDQGLFDGTTFYRTVTMDNQPDNDIKIEVIQGGLGADKDKKRLPPISHETTDQTRILHKDGVISMGRWEPGTASSEFFICVGDQPELDFGGRRNPDGQGFSAFGRVVKGMDVVRRIHRQPALGQILEPEIKIHNIKRI